MLDTIAWGVFGLSCGVIGSTVYSWVEQKKRKVEAPQNEKLGVSLGAVVTRDVDHNTMPKIRIGMIEAMNGKVLEVATAIPNNHGHYDWKTEMYVIPEGQKLSEAVSTVMLMKGLEK
jgi:hypothetical protein